MQGLRQGNGRRKARLGGFCGGRAFIRIPVRAQQLTLGEMSARGSGSQINPHPRGCAPSPAGNCLSAWFDYPFPPTVSNSIRLPFPRRARYRRLPVRFGDFGFVRIPHLQGPRRQRVTATTWWIIARSTRNWGAARIWNRFPSPCASATWAGCKTSCPTTWPTTPENRLLMDVLENGPHSRFHQFLRHRVEPS